MNSVRKMTALRTILAFAAALGLAACASVDTASRNVPVETASRDAPAPLATAPSAPDAVLPSLRVRNISVSVPKTLRVSEANRYYPSSDIVWREDPIGDRHAQVKAIVEAGLAKGTEQMSGNRPVDLHVQVTRFHALTEKARYTVGGVHAIQFYLTVTDARTGETLIPAKFVKADFDALGGAVAIRAEARGITQKVRITGHLARVIEAELTGRSHVVDANPVMGAINQI